jgi:hypothetical protein
MTMGDRKKYVIGFKEIASRVGSIIECHILKKGFLGHVSIFKKEHWKGLCPDYQQIALFTVCDYEQELEQKEKLINAIW